MDLAMLKTIVAGATIVLGIIFPAIAIGGLAKKAMEAMGRNPEAAPKIMPSMILAIAFLEALAIYVLVVSLVVKFG